MLFRINLFHILWIKVATFCNSFSVYDTKNIIAIRHCIQLFICVLNIQTTTKNSERDKKKKKNVSWLYTMYTMYTVYNVMRSRVSLTKATASKFYLISELLYWKNCIISVSICLLTTKFTQFPLDIMHCTVL